MTGKVGRETNEHRWAMQDAYNDCPQRESSKPSPPDTWSLIPTPSWVILEDKASKDHSKGTADRGHGWRCQSAMQQTQCMVVQGPLGVEAIQTQPSAPAKAAHRGPVTLPAQSNRGLLTLAF